MLYATTILHDTNQSERVRIRRTADQVRDLVQEWQPSLLAIEDPPMVRDARIHAVLCRLVGAIEYACTDVQMLLVKPTQAKAALTGRGNATKTQMVEWAQMSYLLRWQFRAKREWEAVADAVGVALAAEQAMREQRLQESARAQNGVMF